jgi:hypothetical protein
MPRKSWWARLPFGIRMAAGGSALLVLIGGGTAGIAALTEDEPRIVTAAGQAAPAEVAAVPPAAPALTAPAPVPTAAGLKLGIAQAEADAAVDDRTSDQADRTGTREPRRPASTGQRPAAAATTPPPRKPEVATRTVTESRAIPYRTRLIRDPELRRGERRIQRPGIAGEEQLRYLVTYTDGQETGRRLLDAVVVREPQHRVVAFGTRRHRGDGDPRECRTGPCIPIGRTAGCDEPVEPVDPAVTESSPARSGGSVTVLDQDVYLLDPSDLDGLELDPALIC